MLKNTLIFVTGAAIGAVVTWKLIEKKYKDLADEEIQSVIDTFKDRKPTKVTPIDEGDSESSKDDETEGELSNGTIENVIDYSKIIKKEQYNTETDEKEDDYTVDLEEENNDDEFERHIPSVIEPEEFGTIEHFGTKTLTLYADNILTDEIDQVFNTEDTDLFPGWRDHIGEYEDDALHIRDIDNEMDYEILRSYKTYSGIAREND